MLLAALAAVLLLLAIDRSLIPGWLHWLSAGQVTTAQSKSLTMTLTGVFPLAALGLIVLVANLVYAWLPPLGWLIPSLAGVASILLVIDLPRDLNHARAVPVDLWIRVPVALFLTILLAKLLLLHRHATRARAQTSNKPPPLLPSQERALEELGKLITDQYLGRVLPLEGRLGEGKSFLVQRLRYDWKVDRSKPAVVVVDVWQQQTESDLQAAILEALYCHPDYLARMGWLHAPASFLFARWIAAIRGWNSTLELRVRQSKVGVQFDLDIPGLRWQSHFERATARMARRGTVIVLDEIDRATPSVTQAALTLARRSVDVPGVTVLIPYIRSLIRYKAFNPLQPTLQDLGSSMDAILYEERFAVRSANALGGDPMDSIRKTWDDLQSQTPPTGDTAAGAPPTPAAEQLTQSLRMGVFANAEGLFRERLHERFEEKYLGAAALRLHPPDAGDLADMVVNFPGLRRQVDALVSAQPNGWEKTFSNAVRGGLSKWQKDHGELVGPPLRVLEGALYLVLQQAVFMAGGRQLSPEDIATLVVAAYDEAGLVHGLFRR